MSLLLISLLAVHQTSSSPYLHPAYAQVALAADARKVAFVRCDAVWTKTLEGGAEVQVSKAVKGAIDGPFFMGNDVAFVVAGELFVNATSVARAARIIAVGPNAVILQLENGDAARWQKKLTVLEQNPGDVLQWRTDQKLEVRAAVALDKLGGRELRVRDGKSWRVLMKVDFGDTLDVLGFSADGKRVRVLTSKGREVTALVERELASGKEKELAALKKMDVRDALFVKDTAVAILGDAREFGAPPGKSVWFNVKAPGPGEPDFLSLSQEAKELEILGRSADAKQWLLAVSDAEKLRSFRLFEPAKNAMRTLFSSSPSLDGVPIPVRSAHAFSARDGLTLVSYGTQLRQMPSKRFLGVVLVREDLEARDDFATDPMASWLASRGYVVFQVNVRGSRGFDKRFYNAANKQWGLAITDDLVDFVEAVRAQVGAKIPMCIMGKGVGGHAALSAAIFTPHAFDCAVAIGAPSHLESWVQAAPAFTQGYVKRRIGDPTDADDVDTLRAASPRLRAKRLANPLFLAHDPLDARVPYEQGTAMRDALTEAKRPFEWMDATDQDALLDRVDGFLSAQAR